MKKIVILYCLINIFFVYQCKSQSLTMHIASGSNPGCIGSTVQFTVTLNPSGGSAINVIWQVNGTVIAVQSSYWSFSTTITSTPKVVKVSGFGTPSTITLYPILIPASAGTISGMTNPCQGQNSVTYNVPTIANSTSYVWTTPSGTIGTSSTNSISLNYGASAVSGNITVKGTNTCGGEGVISTLPITVNSFPSSAGMITGNSTVCQGQDSVTYNVPTIANATSYVWTTPSGTTGTSLTNSITLNYGTSALSGNITVKGTRECGSGAISTYAVTVNSLPASAGTISGTATVCQGQNSVTYTVPSIANATSYIWTLPSGATGTSTTNSITVNYGTSAVSGNITVKGTNTCGNGAISTYAVTVNPLPASAGAITGTASVCQGQNAVTYTVPSIANATSYVWALPSGATGTSTTNNIAVSYGTSAVSGNITVKGANTCGNGAISTFAVTVNSLPATAGTITGTATVCQGQNAVIYTVPTIANATSYVWTLPSGATGTSTTNSIAVSYGTSAVTGNITVKGTNTCGNGATSTYAVTVNPLPATPFITLNGNVLHSDAPLGNQWYNQSGLLSGATIQNYTPLANGDYYVIVTLLGCSSDTSNIINVVLTGIEETEKNKNIKVYPNPFKNELIIESKGNTEILNFEILNAIGQIVYTSKMLDKTNILTDNFTQGIYLIRFKNNKTFETIKIIKE